MKPNQHIAKTFYFSGRGSLLTDHWSGFFSSEIRRAAILTIVLGMTAVLPQVAHQRAVDSAQG